MYNVVYTTFDRTYHINFKYHEYIISIIHNGATGTFEMFSTTKKMPPLEFLSLCIYLISTNATKGYGPNYTNLYELFDDFAILIIVVTETIV